MHPNDFDTRCHCGQPLTGNQRKHCSEPCRKAANRPEPKGGYRTCALCGDPFLPKRNYQIYCNLPGASDECDDMQYELEEMAQYQAKLREERAQARCQNPACAAPIPHDGRRGRPKQFCGRSCQNKIARQRAKARAQVAA